VRLTEQRATGKKAESAPKEAAPVLVYFETDRNVR
jgi:hypothetical protein